MHRFTTRALAATAVAFVACSSSSPSTTAPTTASAPASAAPTTAATSTQAAPPAPNNPSTLEQAGATTKLLLDQTGTGSGESKTFAPSQLMARIRVEWACGTGGDVKANVSDTSGDISGTLNNGFDGPIPVSKPPAKVVFKVTGPCSWHARALDQ